MYTRTYSVFLSSLEVWFCFVLDPSTEKRHDQRRGKVWRRQHTESRSGKGKKTTAKKGRAFMYTWLLDRSDHNEPVQPPEHSEIYRYHFWKELQVYRDGTTKWRRFKRIPAEKPSFSRKFSVNTYWGKLFKIYYFCKLKHTHKYVPQN